MKKLNKEEQLVQEQALVQEHELTLGAEALTGFNKTEKVVIRHSSIPNDKPKSLNNGEIAINTQDAKLFFGDYNQDVHEFATGGGGSHRKSAFEVAVDGGYTKTEQEWIRELDPIEEDAPKDGTGYIRKDGTWEKTSSVLRKTAFDEAVEAGYKDTELTWLKAMSPIAADAPKDGRAYNRVDGRWAVSLAKKTAFDKAVEAGYDKTEQEWIRDLDPINRDVPKDETAYVRKHDSWVKLSELTRPSAFEVAVAEGYTKTEQEWIRELDPINKDAPKDEHGYVRKGNKWEKVTETVFHSAYEKAVADGYKNDEIAWIRDLDPIQQDAPKDTNAYLRRGGKWEKVSNIIHETAYEAARRTEGYDKSEQEWIRELDPIQKDAPKDGTQYARIDGKWEKAASSARKTAYEEAVERGYKRTEVEWLREMDPVSDDAPGDGRSYIRRDHKWVAVEGSKSNVKQPTNIKPSGGLFQPGDILLVVSAFQSVDSSTHADSNFQVSDDIQFNNIILDEHEIGPVTSFTCNMDKEGLFFWRARYKNANDEWSLFSSPTSFSISTGEINKPVITSPVDGEEVGNGFTVIGSEFQAVNESTKQIGFQCQIAVDPEFTNIIHDSGRVPVPATSYAVDIEKYPNEPTRMYMRIRYQGNTGFWTVWSDSVTVTTEEQFDFIQRPAQHPEPGHTFEGGTYVGMMWECLAPRNTVALANCAEEHTLGVGFKTFNVNIDMSKTPMVYKGQKLEIRSENNPDNHFKCEVVGARGYQLYVIVTEISGSGTYSDWYVMSKYRIIVHPNAGSFKGTLGNTNITASGESLSPEFRKIHHELFGIVSEGYFATYKALIVSANKGNDFPIYDKLKTVTQMNVNGYVDWYFPARDEMEMIYRVCKPDDTPNMSENELSKRPLDYGRWSMSIPPRYGSYGDGPNSYLNGQRNSVEPGEAYTGSYPAVTTLQMFKGVDSPSTIAHSESNRPGGSHNGVLVMTTLPVVIDEKTGKSDVIYLSDFTTNKSRTSDSGGVNVLTVLPAGGCMSGNSLTYGRILPIRRSII